MDNPQTVFNLLKEIDVLSTVLCEIVVEYMFSLYEDILIKTVNVPHSWHIITTIKNGKSYIFDHNTKKLNICHIDDIYRFNIAYNISVQILDNGCERVYVHDAGLLYIFNERCILLTEINVGTMCRYNSDILSIASDNYIYLYDSDTEYGQYIVKYNMYLRVSISAVILDNIIHKIVPYDSHLYVLLKGNKILKINNKLEILEQKKFLDGSDPNQSINSFCIINDELYLSTKPLIHIFGIDGYYLRCVKNIGVGSIMSDKSMLYFHDIDILNIQEIIHMYQRKKIKLY